MGGWRGGVPWTTEAYYTKAQADARYVNVTGDTMTGALAMEQGASPVLYTGTGAGELSRYLQLINSAEFSSASGLKVGGLLVADSYSYANPGKNDAIVKGSLRADGGLFVDANNYVTSLGATYGSLRVQGTNNGYAGIRFGSVERTFMVNATYQGIFQEGVGWQWYWKNGVLEVGSVPWGRLTGVPSTFPPSAHTHPYQDITGTPSCRVSCAAQTLTDSIEATVPVSGFQANTGGFTISGNSILVPRTGRYRAHFQVKMNGTISFSGHFSIHIKRSSDGVLLADKHPHFLSGWSFGEEASTTVTLSAGDGFYFTLLQQTTTQGDGPSWSTLYDGGSTPMICIEWVGP